MSDLEKSAERLALDLVDAYREVRKAEDDAITAENTWNDARRVVAAAHEKVKKIQSWLSAAIARE